MYAYIVHYSWCTHVTVSLTAQCYYDTLDTVLTDWTGYQSTT